MFKNPMFWVIGLLAVLLAYTLHKDGKLPFIGGSNTAPAAGTGAPTPGAGA